jgi:hypothetical protein
MPWLSGCPQDPAQTFGDLTPVAITLHRTYGGWSGDYSVGKNQGLFQFLVGQDDGQWVQFADTNRVSYHCNGANFKSFGIELTGTNEDVLTPWQVARLGEILHWAHDTHGIPLDYLDPGSTPPASVHVNSGSFSGVISHVSVQTDDGSAQHSDLVTVEDFNRAIGSTGDDDVTPEQMAQLGQWMKDQAALIEQHIDNGVWKWVTENGDPLLRDIQSKVGVGTGSGGITEAQVRAVVRDELNKTKLTS